MSRLTGTDAYGLMEAYNNVYAPQELTEEQIWEEVETWVNALIEEGYDLSDYTWEEMFESYINEDLIGDLRANAGNIKRGLSGAYQGAMKTASNVNKSISDRMQSNIKSVKPAPSFQQSAGFGRYGAPETQRGNQDKYKSTSDGKMYKNYNDALAANRSRNKKTDTPTSTPTTPVPANRTPGVTPAPAAKPAATTLTAKSAPASTTTPTPAPSASLSRPSLSSQASELRQMRARSLERQGKPLSAAVVSATAKPTAYQANSFDPFDVIKGHLIDEGYADTEESALVIMANMSEEWREEILDEAKVDKYLDNKLKKSNVGDDETGRSIRKDIKISQRRKRASVTPDTPRQRRLSQKLRDNRDRNNEDRRNSSSNDTWSDHDYGGRGRESPTYD